MASHGGKGNRSAERQYPPPLLAVESLSPAAQGSPYSITKLLWFCDGEVKENDKSLGMVVEFINSINDTFLWGNLRAQPDRGEKRLLGVL